jgi:hypothetical protein
LLFRLAAVCTAQGPDAGNPLDRIRTLEPLAAEWWAVDGMNK